MYDRTMKKLIFGIFAHPDDEAFGPAGTLLTEVKAGSDLHLITLTTGQAGTNPDNVPDLGAVRLKEWHEAGKRLGATSMHELGFTDGALCNEMMLSAATMITAIVQHTAESYDEDTTIEFISFDLTGITGHIDHIVATRAACLVFYRLKTADPRLTRLRLYCLPDYHAPTITTDWLFMEAGKSAEMVDEIIDARQYRDEIIHAMEAHHSQRGDFAANLERSSDMLGLDYFIVKT